MHDLPTSTLIPCTALKAKLCVAKHMTCVLMQLLCSPINIIATRQDAPSTQVPQMLRLLPKACYPVWSWCAGYAYLERAVQHFLSEVEGHRAQVLFSHPVQHLEAAEGADAVRDMLCLHQVDHVCQ